MSVPPTSRTARRRGRPFSAATAEAGCNKLAAARAFRDSRRDSTSIPSPAPASIDHRQGMSGRFGDVLSLDLTGLRVGEFALPACSFETLQKCSAACNRAAAVQESLFTFNEYVLIVCVDV